MYIKGFKGVFMQEKYFTRKNAVFPMFVFGFISAFVLGCDPKKPDLAPAGSSVTFSPKKRDSSSKAHSVSSPSPTVGNNKESHSAGVGSTEPVTSTAKGSQTTSPEKKRDAPSVGSTPSTDKGQETKNISVYIPKNNMERLEVAVLNGDTLLVARLLSLPEIKENINKRNKTGRTFYFIAVEDGYFEIADLLYRAGADPFVVQENGDTLLMRMAAEGNKEAVQYLLSIDEVKKNIDKKNKKNWRTAFFFAVEGDAFRGSLHFETADLLHKAGAYPDVSQKKNRDTLLMWMIRNHRINAIRYLLTLPEIKAIINRAYSRYYSQTIFANTVEIGLFEIADLLYRAGADPLTFTQRRGGPPLYWMAAEGNKEAVQYLLSIDEVKENINKQSFNSWTALAAAVDQGHFETADLLYQAGADPVGTRENKGGTLLYWMAAEGNKEAVQYLLSIDEVKKNINKLNDYSELAAFAAFTVAVDRGHFEIADLLYQAGADPIATHYGKTTTLHVMADKGRKDAVQYLLSIDEVKKNIDKPDISMWTAFTGAIRLRHFETADLLRKAGANPVVIHDGKTPLYWMIYYDKKEVVQYLLTIDEVKENINNKQNSNGWTAFATAVDQGRFEIADLLYRAGADPVAASEDKGDTLLYWMAYYGNKEAVRYLLSSIGIGGEVKENINKQNTSSDETAYSIAVKKGHSEIADLLKAYGANSEIPHREGKKRKEKKTRFHTRQDDSGKNTTGKNRKQSPLLRETAEAEKKKTSLPEDSFWERALSGLKKLLY